jgi:hypothetical protein
MSVVIAVNRQFQCSLMIEVDNEIRRVLLGHLLLRK